MNDARKQGNLLLVTGVGLPTGMNAIPTKQATVILSMESKLVKSFLSLGLIAKFGDWSLK